MPRRKKIFSNPAPTPVTIPASQPSIARYLNVRLAAEYAGITPWAIRRLVYSGQLKAAKLGKRLTVDRFEIDQLWKRRAGSLESAKVAA
jgi:hypothetical protein